MKYLSFDVGIKNLGYCILDDDLKIYNWGIINIIEDSKKKINTDELCNLLWDKLDEIDDMVEVDRVVIENQPSLKNPKMKTIQIFILSYFVAQQRTLTTKIFKIDCFLPRNKLNIYQGENKKELEDSIKTQNKYSRTKKLSVLFTKEMIKDQPEWLEILNTNNKKDDLADSFMQGACYIDRQKKNKK